MPLTSAVMSTMIWVLIKHGAGALHSAGICAENKALEANYLRVLKAGQVSEAQDARIEQKRWAGIAAERQYAGYLTFANR